MTDRDERVRVLYELALAIEPGETVQETAEQALTAYLQKLNCSVGAVFAESPTAIGGYERVTALPTTVESNDLFTAAEARLTTWATTPDADRESLPLADEPSPESHYYLFELPEFGVLLLGKHGPGLDDAVIDSLGPLNEKLATACTTKQVEAELREERDRLEAIFTTIQEPVVNVSLTDDTPVVKRANEPYRETFGDPDAASAATPEANETDGSGDVASIPWIEPTTPPDEETAEAAVEIDARLARGEPVTEEIRRETTDGVGDFLLRAVPVADGRELFAMYVDITEEKRRQRTLQSLYQEAQEVLTSEDRETACSRTVATALSIIDADLAEIHLYDRGSDSLQPAATTHQTPVVGRGEALIDDTLLWATYTGEARCLDNLSAADGDLPHTGLAIESVMLLPLGDHGVLVIGDERRAAFDETDFQAAKLLAALVEVALGRARRQQSLETIQELTQEVLTTESPEAMVEPVLDRLPDALDLPLTGIWQYDAGRDRLEPLGMTDPATDLFDAPPTFYPGDSIAWDAFEDGETQIIPDIGDHPNPYNEDSQIRSEVIAPLGEFGLLMAGSVRPQDLTELDRNIADTLASNLETSMELINSRQELDLLDQLLGRVLRHNIRNDLSVITGYAKVLEDQADGEYAAITDPIVTHCENLERTADNARTMQQVVQTRDTRRGIPVDTVVDDALQRLRDDWPTAAEISVDIDSEAAVLAHPKLPTAIFHLLQNSLEHGIPDGTAADSVSVATEEDDDHVVIEVADDGPGIPEDELAVVEQHGESALEHGSGIGLWLIDRIVQYSNATIEYETSSGTTARIRLERA
ncbi:hypothetical protein EGH24_02135 [Halonotius terrestris]|uniref:histidine kinase n=1 Tax=Halonotius terrestris TaxID=2487750 RepID=A0A8J8PBR6_9EURY|nr:GAF domain-containing protein [Halonotius terrestris]TQQ83613.1 hypothetical protein EGH24_02135 [Halonotius terrestris]